MKQSTKEIGACYEKQALADLKAQGLLFVAANVQCRHDEIDLIMKDNNTWVFVEVRFRKNARFGEAAATVTLSKQNKLLRAAYYWLQQQGLNPEQTSFRFDVFAITGQEKQWIPNAFS